MAAYRKAVDKGSTSAMVELGVLFGTGQGVAKDSVEARKMFARAAEAGNPRGVTNLAVLSGGKPSDPVQARALQDSAAAKAHYEKAAALGNEDAKAALKRLECPYVIKDKRGTFVSNLCF
jgi:TPR repeat protein